MGIGKIFLGVVLIVIGTVIWWMFSTPSGALTQILFSSPGARMDFADAVQGIKALYFLCVIGLGIGLIIWGSQQ